MIGVLVDGMVPDGDAGAIGTVTDAVSLYAPYGSVARMVNCVREAGVLDRGVACGLGRRVGVSSRGGIEGQRSPCRTAAVV